VEHIGEILRREPPMKTGAGDLPETVEEILRCDKCKGEGWVYLDVPVGHELFGKAVRCSCRQEQDWQEREAFALKYCELPLGAKDYTLENYDCKLGSEEAYEAARAVARGELLWLVLNGGKDRGKTHLAIAICWHWLATGKVARYVHVPLLLDELREGFEDKERSFEQRFNHFKKVPLLVLDDLGVQVSTPWVDERLQTLIDYRYINQLPLVITVNKALDQLPGDKEGRIESRLKRMVSSRIVLMEVGEYRTVRNVQ